MTIILIGAIITIIGGSITAFGTFLHNKQSSEKSTRIETGVNRTNDEVAELRKQNDSLKANSYVQLNKIDELRRENNELSSKLLGKSLDIYNNLTGGGDNNKPVIIIIPSTFMNEDKPQIPYFSLVQFLVKNNGKFPLRNVTIKICDFWGREMIKYGVKHTVNGMMIGGGVIDKEKEYKEFNPYREFSLGTLSPNVQLLLYRTTYSPDLTPAPAGYNVEVFWDGGYLIHFVTFKIEHDQLVLGHWEALFNGQPFKDMSCIEFKNN